ncbi:OLC1v1031801C1 [Oldenlandia corymbosa var. corymbosa]|uniref:OLC1v1031801C1 n=1 Tax=Oldenlandia corymbosa var. corymbosa TaxID=529605 RepID=A0AAV1CJD8_OLDCO|nr:OLC1v1031801C1 [Oldenlandia corymbosa var. corymbosa]
MSTFFSYYKNYTYLLFLFLFLLHCTPSSCRNIADVTRRTPQSSSQQNSQNNNSHERILYDTYPNMQTWGDGPHLAATVTYSFLSAYMIDYLSLDDIRAAFGSAFSQWADVTPLNFMELPEVWKTDITIGFFVGDHGDGYLFDGPGGEVGHAEPPRDGRLHLDGDERWTVNLAVDPSEMAYDLESAAVHLIGHTLGLRDSTVIEAVMHPNLTARTRKVELAYDDIAGIQALYGAIPNTPNRHPDPSSSTSLSGFMETRRRRFGWNTLLTFVLVSLSLL